MKRYYVSVIDGARKGLLLGPYASHMLAEMNISRGRRMAEKADPWSDFYAFGTAGSERTFRTVFGRGRTV